MTIIWKHGTNAAQKVHDLAPLYNHRVKEEQIINFIIENGNKTVISNNPIIGVGIDKLSVTIPSIDTDQEKEILARCLQLKKEEQFHGKNLKEVYVADGIYKHHFTYTTPSKEDIRIDFSPFKSSSNFFRFEINPDLLFKAGEMFLFTELMNDLHFMGLDLNTLKITRIDPYVDIEVPTSHVICKSTARSCSVIKDNDGTIRTHYLGSTTSKVEYRIYDKALKSQKDGDPVKQPYLTRVEVELANHTLTELTGINPFERLELFICSQDIQHHDHNFQMFMDSCYQRGLPQVLARKSPSQAKPYLDKLKAFTPHYWDKEAIHKAYKDELLKLLEVVTMLGLQ